LKSDGAAGANASTRSLLLAASFSGAAVMIVELTATRLFAPWFGASIYAWTNVVAVVLAALSLGYAVGGKLADRKPSRRFLGFALLVAAAATAAASALGPSVAALLAPELSGDPASHVGDVVFGSLVAGAAVFGPPLFLLGWTSPFVAKLLTEAGVPEGAAVGRTLATSTVGSLVGAYLPAFVLLDSFGSRGSILAAAGLLVVAAALLFSGGAEGRRATFAAATAIVVAGVANAWTPYVAALPGETLVRDAETSYQYVRISDFRAPDGRGYRNLSLDEGRGEFHSRKALDGGPLTDAYYDYLAVVPEYVADVDERPVDVLVIGGGAGTLRGLLRTFHDARVRRVVDVEIDPYVAAAAAEFGGPARAPDATWIVDGRTALRSGEDRFDLIVLDAYARQIAIPAHLGTKEAFEDARRKLTPRGIFAVNVSAADIESPLVASLGKTLAAVFPDVRAVPVENGWNIALLCGAVEDASRVERSRGDALDPIRAAFARRMTRLDPDARGDATILYDDRAPLERLARRIR
jgi:spermidine synthase